MSLHRFSLVIALLSAGCSFDWSSLDPREASSTTTGVGGGQAQGGGGEGQGGAATGGSSSSTGGAATGTGGSGAVGGAGGAGGSKPVEVSYAASVAECIFLGPTGAGGANTAQMHDPDVCANVSGGGTELSVDYTQSTNGLEARGYLRFDLDGQLAGLTVTTVELRLTSTEGGPNAGEIWLVAPFVEADLFNGPPPRQGNAPVTPNPGSVAAADETVVWSLPPSSVSAGGSLTIELRPLPTSDQGVDYHNNLGTTPPELRVTAQ